MRYIPKQPKHYAAHPAVRYALALIAAFVLIGSNILAQATPEDVLDQFMTAWNDQNFEAMYALLHPQAQELYPMTIFQNRYNAAQIAMNFTGVTYEVESSRIQGISAELHYDAVIQSSAFEEIQDSDRTMRMMQADGNWRIAWSSMDILRDMAADITLQPTRTFPTRASIYDTNGLPLAADNSRIINLWARRIEVINEEACFNTLAQMMFRSYSEIEGMFSPYPPGSDTYFALGETDPETYARYSESLRNDCGIYDDNGAQYDKVYEFTARNYYGHGAAAHITGYVGSIPQEELAFYQGQGYSSGDYIGRAGVERSMQEYLAGKAESHLQMVEPGGLVIRDLGTSTGAPATPVQLTIDRDLQYAVSKAISDAYLYAEARNWGQEIYSTGAAAVVIDIHTGAILAMSSYPTYDPRIFDLQNTGYGELVSSYLLNRASQTDTREPLANKALRQYTPGSVFKIFTAAATAQEGIFPIDDSEQFNCDLYWNGTTYGDTVGDRPDWRVADELDAAGPVYLWQALSTSCNPFFWEMGGRLWKLGPSVNVSYEQRFGLGQPTGIVGLGSEDPGNLALPNNPTSAINNAIGQGDVQVTPLQMAVAVAAVANNGTVYQPYIIQQIGGLDGTDVVSVTEPTVKNELGLDQAVLDIVRRGMCNVPVDDILGTSYVTFGPNADPPPPYTSCGKTGTAQAGPPGSEIPPHAWYVSYAPAEDPQIATVVMVLNSREGSEVAAPITRRILDTYFNAEQWPYPSWWNEVDYIPVPVPQGIGTEG